MVYTAKYTKIDSGYMGQLIQWPEVVTEGHDIEECRLMLRDALREMILAYQQLSKETPLGNDLFEQVYIDLESAVGVDERRRRLARLRDLDSGRPGGAQRSSRNSADRR